MGVVAIDIDHKRATVRGALRLGWVRDGNDYFPQSAWGLPSGPIDPDATPGGDKIQAPKAMVAGDPWNFAFSVPYASV
ncbi:MAG: hypothetical protein JO046_20940, partial [Solirubrobacterales bacterium]|nr:hypothetical protein [Solirubrobacterales bacterium]